MKAKAFYLNLLLRVLLLSLILTLYLPTSFAQNYTQMSLPEDAKARLGKGYIKDLLYSPKGDILAVVSSIGIWLYDTKTYQELTLLPIPKNRNRALAHRIRKTVFSVDGQTLVSWTEENVILIWNVATGEHKEIINRDGISFSSNGQKLTIEAENKTIELWDDKKEKIEKPDKQYGEIDIIIAYSPDGKTSATVDDEYNIKINDTRKRKLSKFHIKFPAFKYGQKIYVSPDAKTLATVFNDSPIHLWDVNTGNLKKTLAGHIVKKSRIRINTRYEPSMQVDSVAFSPDGKTLANGSLDGTIHLWNTNSGKLKRILAGQFGFIKGLTFSPDGKLLASGSDDGSILVWDTETGKHEPFLAERVHSISCVSFSRDGSMLVGGSPNGDIHLFDVVTGNPTKIFTGHIGEISHLMFSPDGSKIASACWDGSVRLWDIETEKLLKTLTAPVSVHFNRSCRALLFTDVGNLLGINHEYDFIHLWNVTTGQYKQMLMGHASHLVSFSVSGNGKTLASYSADGTVLLWDLTSITKATD